MPYTNPWSDAIPLGTAAASTIDNAIRQLRLDVHERMDSLVVDWTADPIVPLPSVSGANVLSAVSYDNDLLPGAKAANYLTLVASLAFHFRGNAFNENVVINFNEVNTLTGTTNWQVSNLYNPLTQYFPLSFVGRRSGDVGLVLRRAVPDIPSNTITMIFDNISVLLQQIEFMAVFGFTVAP